MNKKAFELAISTLIILILAVVILALVAFSLTGGFSRFKEASQPVIDITELSGVKNACQIACTNNDQYSFCCMNQTIKRETITCTDSRLTLDCPIACSQVSCNR